MHIHVSRFPAAREEASGVDLRALPDVAASGSSGAGASSENDFGKLTQLMSWRMQGLLSEVEFTSAQQRLLRNKMHMKKY